MMVFWNVIAAKLESLGVYIGAIILSYSLWGVLTLVNENAMQKNLDRGLGDVVQSISNLLIGTH
jgi:hypothetical protein